MIATHLDQIELSQRWKLSPRTLERWRSEGSGPAYRKIAGRVVYDIDEIEHYEAEHKLDECLSVGKRRTAVSVAHSFAVAATNFSPPSTHQTFARPPETPMDCPFPPIRTALEISEIDLLAWAAQAEPGDRITYHTGYLALDRAGMGRYPMNADDRRALVRLANRAMALADQGLIHLFQKRIERDRFSYLAIATNKPNRGAALAAHLDTETSDGAALSARTGGPSFGARSAPRRPQPSSPEA
jgi:hypothetical protein